MITPTEGRILWFTPAQLADDRMDKSRPLASIVAYVWNDRLVNLTVFTQTGGSFAQTSVKLLQDEDEVPIGGFYAQWMPYQLGQAARTEAAEAKAVT